MAKTDYQSVDHYLAAQPAKARSVLDVVRAAIRGALPEAEEQISYQIPAYRGAGGTFLYFAGWKAHHSIYPASGALVAAFAEELKPYQVNKGTIRFPYDGPVPATLICRIARFLADEAAARKK